LKPKLSKLLYQASESFKKNHFKTASLTVKEILNIFPEQIDATIILLKITIQNRDYVQSEILIKNILKHDKHNKDTLLIKLQLLEIKELFFEAIDTLDTLLVTEPQNLQFKYKKGLNALKAGQIYLAETLLLNCHKIGFDDPFLKLNLGHIYKAKGESDKAAEFYQHFIKDFPEHSAVGYWSMADLKDYRLKSSDTEEIQALINIKTLSSGNKSLLLFTLGRIHEQHKRYEESFESIHLANQLMKDYRPFQADLYSKLINDFITKFKIPPEAQQNNQEYTPIFIVGMPRSGTTLVEQILASHTEVESTDELPYMERIGLELDMMGGYIENLNNITNKQADNFADQYTQQVKQYLPTLSKMVIDKNPNNFVHIGLIKTLFPKAKIINVVRNPLDNALSVYKQFFSNGHNYSYSLKGIEHYWKGYLSLMNHWETVYPMQIYQLSYEKLVSDTENEIKQLLYYCQIKFEKQCLTFYESDRVVLTPSVSQVRQPITARSIGSWKKYQPYITQFLPAFTELEDKANLLVNSLSKLD